MAEFDKLKPCPFCGSAEVRLYGGARNATLWIVECRGC